jgi:putative salt-induced outer membrane protein
MSSQPLLHTTQTQCTQTAARADSRAITFALSAGYKARIRQCLLLLAAMISVGTARADTVTLQNGDRLTGMVVKSDGKELTLKTDYSAAPCESSNSANRCITVQWSAVREIMSSAPLFIVTPQGMTVGGMVTTEGGDLVIAPASGPPQRVPLAAAPVIRAESEQTAYERSLHPGVLESWQVNASLGFGLARGNSHTTNLAVGFNAARPTLHDKLTAYMNSIYASSGLLVAPGIAAGVTANDIRGGAMYQHDLLDRAFAYGSADFEYNELQFLNLRSIWGAGAGYHVIKRMDTTLDLFGGANYTRESYAIGLRRNVAALTIGDLFRHQIGTSTTINEALDIYPELSHLGEYRFALDISVATKIKTWLGWQSTISDRYISDPIPGTVANDFIFSTGLSFTFNH